MPVKVFRMYRPESHAPAPRLTFRITSPLGLPGMSSFLVTEAMAFPHRSREGRDSGTATRALALMHSFPKRHDSSRWPPAPQSMYYTAMPCSSAPDMTQFHPELENDKRGTLAEARIPRPNVVGRVGIEPTTIGLKGRCSTTELPTHDTYYSHVSPLRNPHHPLPIHPSSCRRGRCHHVTVSPHRVWAQQPRISVPRVIMVGCCALRVSAYPFPFRCPYL